MPIFEFKCLNCSAVFSKIESYEDSEILKKPCPVCGKVRNVEKVLSVPAKRNPDLGIQR